MGKFIFFGGIALCGLALVLFIAYIVLAKSSLKRLKKTLDNEYGI
ncbi:hypothetical protein [Pseudobutyrivibrio sp.]|nr:hypothetical protein [Pseudobutyrivibrio sp.]